MLAEWLKIEPHALRFGEQAAQSIRNKRQQWDEALDYQERETIEQYLGLPITLRMVVREVIEAFAKAFSGETQVIAGKK